MSKCELCGEPMPAGEEMFKYHGYSGDCPKPPMPRDDCDVTGQPGPLPETGWDEVPADALNRALTQRPAAQTEREAFESAALAKWGPLDFERSEAVPEMYYNQRLDDAWIGFGFAVAWLRASLPAPQQATPDHFPDAKEMVQDQNTIKKMAQATPEPVAAWVDLKDGETVQLGDRLFSGGKSWRTVDHESQLVGREYHAGHWWPMQRLYTGPAPAVPEGWTVAAYKAAGLTIQSMAQLKGPDLWKIADAAGNVLNKQGDWEWEPTPSNRDDEFLARCRYATLTEASAALAAAQAKGG